MGTDQNLKYQSNPFSRGFYTIIGYDITDFTSGSNKETIEMRSKNNDVYIYKGSKNMQGVINGGRELMGAYSFSNGAYALLLGY